MYIQIYTYKHKNLQVLKLDSDAVKLVMTNRETTIYPDPSAYRNTSIS